MNTMGHKSLQPSDVGNTRHKWLCVERLGFGGAVRYKCLHFLGILLERLGQLKEGATYTLTAKGCQYPLFVRYNASDRKVFSTIFVDQEYAALLSCQDVRLVIDCGANVGYSSVWFLDHFPHAQVIAVEPDPKNFALLTRNLRPYADRATLINASIWSHEAGLVLRHFGAGAEWGIQVRECTGEETPDVRATDIPALLTLSGQARVDILKIDIEGSETILFDSESRRWIGQADNIVAELHVAECEKVFFGALADGHYELSTCGELTICKNLRFAGF